MRQILIIYSLLKNFTKMKRRHIIIAKRYFDNKFIVRGPGKNENEISRTDMLFYRSFADIITSVIEKDSGHRYLLDVRDTDNNSKLEANIKLCCKRVAIFVKRKLEEYDNTLKIDIIKLY
nr:MAG TPA: hypothetical protein [Microviridae sp.]